MHGIGAEQGGTQRRCLHHCYNLVRTGGSSAALSSLFLLPQTESVARETMTFPKVFLKHDLVGHVVSLRVKTFKINLNLTQWKLSLFQISQ